MTAAAYVALGLGIGAAGALQAVLAGVLARGRGPLEAGWITGLGMAGTLALVLAARSLRGDGPDLPAPLDRAWPFAIAAAICASGLLASMRGLPAHLALVGPCGGLIVGGAAFLAPRLGATLLFSVVTAGTLAGALALDHAGAFGSEPQRATLTRVLGVLVVLAGVAIVRGR